MSTKKDLDTIAAGARTLYYDMEGDFMEDSEIVSSFTDILFKDVSDVYRPNLLLSLAMEALYVREVTGGESAKDVLSWLIKKLKKKKHLYRFTSYKKLKEYLGGI